MPRALLVEPHRQLVLGDFGLVAAVGARPPQQLRRGKAKHVASRLLDVDDLGAELRELGANIRLSDQLPGANRADAFQWPERRYDARRFRSLQTPDPSRDRTPKLLDLALILDKPWIVRHAHLRW